MGFINSFNTLDAISISSVYYGIIICIVPAIEIVFHCMQPALRRCTAII